jgi:hypothetical protein
MAASPPVDKRNLHLTFQVSQNQIDADAFYLTRGFHRIQQFTLAMNISELIVFLNRPYFAQALHDSPGDPTRSRYGQSYLAVVERCNVSIGWRCFDRLSALTNAFDLQAIVTIATNLHALYPHAAGRHWWIWVSDSSVFCCRVSLTSGDCSIMLLAPPSVWARWYSRTHKTCSAVSPLP